MPYYLRTVTAGGTVGYPPVNRSQQFAGLPHLALIPPEACEAHGGTCPTQFHSTQDGSHSDRGDFVKTS
jgi:hypothetical protein